MQATSLACPACSPPVVREREREREREGTNGEIAKLGQQCLLSGKKDLQTSHSLASQAAEESDDGGDGGSEYVGGCGVFTCCQRELCLCF